MFKLVLAPMGISFTVSLLVNHNISFVFDDNTIWLPNNSYSQCTKNNLFVEEETWEFYPFITKMF